MSATEWRSRWKAAGVFAEEIGAPTHDCIWWSGPGFFVTIHHSPYGHGAGGRPTMVTIDRVQLDERLGHAGPPWPRSVTWREGELDALDLSWLPVDVRPVLTQLLAPTTSAAKIAKGDRVRVESGKDRGREGVVFWIGPSKFGPGERIGIEVTPNEKIWSTPEAVTRATASSPDGWTALHEACDAGHIERVESLLREGADPSVKTGEARASKTVRHLRHDAGSTPLHVAVWLGAKNSLAMVRALLAAGADPNAPNAAGQTCADLLGTNPGNAGSQVFAELIPVLAQAGANFERAALGAFRHTNGVVLLALAKSGFDFDQPLAEGPSLRARLEKTPEELQWKKKRTVLNAARGQSTS